MCGIAGVIEFANPADLSPSALERMAGVLRHRGPDDQGFYVSGGTGLAHRRLSIIDLSPGGHQPKLSEDGLASVVFNGEIYNFPELRAELEAKGERFESRSDTEVLLKAYRVWGEDCTAFHPAKYSSMACPYMVGAAGWRPRGGPGGGGVPAGGEGSVPGSSCRPTIHSLPV